ncbi:MAG: hypothetical protein JNL79_18210 [Myxococcales bacterium]|nr:hypothetical protein [Myxococcales bacterium]
MRRPLHRSFSALLVSSFLLVGSASLVGCEDPKSIEWQVKHLTDANPLERQKAIGGIEAAYRNADQSGDEKKKKEFRDTAIEALAKAYSSDVLKDSSKDRKKIMDILSQADDKRAKVAFVHAIKNYKPGDNDDEAKAATRAILKNKADYAGDEELGKALVAGLKAVKFQDRRSGELGAMFGDGLSSIKPKGVAMELMAILTTPNDGLDTIPNKELTGKQAIAAQVLGEIGDKAIVPQLIDLMFDLGSRMAKRKDPTTGEDVEMGSPLTSAIAQIIGGSLSKIGEPVIDPLMPYVKDDETNPKVKETKEKFKKYISPGGSGSANFYVMMATTVVVNVGLPKVSQEVAGIVKDPKTKDSDRKALIGLMVSLPADPTVIEALKQGFTNSKENKLKTDIVASASRMMEKELAPWLIGIGTDKKNSEDLRTAALGSALWLSPKADLAGIKKGWEELKLLDKPDPLWRAMEPTEKECDPTKLTGKDKDNCQEHPEKKKPDGKSALYVMWNDVTPKYSEEFTIVDTMVGKCDQDAKCYFGEFQAAVKEVDKQGFTKVTKDGTRAGIRMQKAIWMLAIFGGEDDMVELVKFMPSISSPAGRSFVQMCIDKNLHNGSVKVADAIQKLVKSEREKGSETANREAAQLEPIATKLRARAAAGKK